MAHRTEVKMKILELTILLQEWTLKIGLLILSLLQSPGRLFPTMLLEWASGNRGLPWFDPLWRPKNCLCKFLRGVCAAFCSTCLWTVSNPQCSVVSLLSFCLLFTQKEISNNKSRTHISCRIRKIKEDVTDEANKYCHSPGQYLYFCGLCRGWGWLCRTAADKRAPGACAY